MVFEWFYYCCSKRKKTCSKDNGIRDLKPWSGMSASGELQWEGKPTEVLGVDSRFTEQSNPASPCNLQEAWKQ